MDPEVENARTRLFEKKEAWLALSPHERARLLDAVASAIASVAAEWAAAHGGEWRDGPVAAIRHARLLASAQRTPHGPRTILRTRRDGRVVARIVAPSFASRAAHGVTSDVWIEPGKSATFAGIKAPGGVRLVADRSAAVLDVLYTLFAENELAVVTAAGDEASPTARALAPLVTAGWVALVEADADADAASPFDPLTHARAVLILPGPWSDRDVAYQAEHVARVVGRARLAGAPAPLPLVTAQSWLQRKAFLRALGAVATIDGAFAEVALDADEHGHADVPTFLSRCVTRANDIEGASRGSVMVLVHPATSDEHDGALREAYAALRFAAVGVNTEPDLVHGPETRLFEHPEKIVLQGPFRPRLAPADGRALVALEATPSLGRLVAALRSGTSRSPSASLARASGDANDAVGGDRTVERP